MRRSKEPKCAIIGAVCPRNGDPANGDFCPAWWRIEYVNDDTGQKETRGDCAWRHLPSYFQQTGKLARVCANTAMQHRDAVAEGFSAIIGAPVTGQGHLLPEEHKNALRAAGELQTLPDPEAE